MFIVSIGGGLGSQMDQYSFFLALKKRYPDTIIKLDILNIFKRDHNGYELERIFKLTPPTANINEIKELSDIYPHTGKHKKIYDKLYTIRRNIFGIKESWITPDDPSAYYEEVFKLNPLKPYMFFGNWSNEKYRVNIEKEIQDSFKFPPFEDSNNINIGELIKKTNSVSIHVRHGDYIQYGFPTISLDYYKKAIEIINSKIENPYFFIFSDDIQYVKENFSFLDNYKMIDFNKKENSFRDMQLMSMCKHNIIANSTFSYWGARLNQNPNKIVICPRYHIDICKHPAACDSWIILNN